MMNDEIKLSLEKKLKALNLLLITEAMKQFLIESFPDSVLMIEKNSFDFQYVRFSQGKPYFYSEAYVRENSLDELMNKFALIAMELK